MKYLLLLFMIPFLSASECGKKDNKPEEKATTAVPACLQKIIDEAGKEIPPTIPMQVDEYLFMSKKVFLVTAPCCDHYNVVYDEDCKMICAPSGGFSGKGDGKCNDFSSVAKHVKLLWKNPAK